jgi:hypothetical protein
MFFSQKETNFCFYQQRRFNCKVRLFYNWDLCGPKPAQSFLSRASTSKLQVLLKFTADYQHHLQVFHTAR